MLVFDPQILWKDAGRWFQLHQIGFGGIPGAAAQNRDSRPWLSRVTLT